MFFYQMREKKSEKKEIGIEIDQLLMFSRLDESYPVEMADIYQICTAWPQTMCSKQGKLKQTEGLPVVPQARLQAK